MNIPSVNAGPLIIQSSATEPNYLPIYLEIFDTPKLAENEKSIYHQFKIGEGQPRLFVEKKHDKIILTATLDEGIPLYCPKDMPELISGKSGNLALGVFPIVLNDQGEILFIKKIEKKSESVFWYVPGGLIEGQDESLWSGGVREVKEETGITLDNRLEGKMLFAYESVTPTRHNMMIFYSVRYLGMETLSRVPDDEVIERRWLSPRLFWQHYISDKLKSLPSIKLVFQHFIQNQFLRLPKALVESYELHKKRFVDSRMVDEFLLDLCFLEIEGQCSSAVDVSSLIEDAVKLARGPC